MDFKLNISNAPDDYNILIPGSMIPDFAWKDQNEKSISTSSFVGKFTLIILFATGCRYCENNFKYIETKLSPSMMSSINILAVCRSCDADQVLAFRERHPLNIKMIADPLKEIYSKFAEKAVPRNYLFAPSGKLISSVRGFRTDKIDTMFKMIIADSTDALADT